MESGKQGHPQALRCQPTTSSVVRMPASRPQCPSDGLIDLKEGGAKQGNLLRAPWNSGGPRVIYKKK